MKFIPNTREIKLKHVPATKRVLGIFVSVWFFFLLSATSTEAALTEKMVRDAWEDVTKIVEMEPLPLSIVGEKSPNAWVTAGRSVTVTKGLMNLLEREEEIFGVLSHEAGHAKLKHYESRMSNAAGIGLLAAILGKALDSNVGDVAVGLGANLATAGFSREQEVAADDFAVDMALKGGKDPTGLYTALQRMSYYGGSTQPSGFNSHPPDERRLNHIKDRILAKAPETKFPVVKKPEKK